MEKERNYVISLDVNFEGDKYALAFDNENVIGFLKLTSEYSLQDFIDLILINFKMYPNYKIVYDGNGASMCLGDYLVNYDIIPKDKIFKMNYNDAKDSKILFPKLSNILNEFKRGASLDKRIEIEKIENEAKNIEVMQTYRGLLQLRKKDNEISNIRIHTLLNGLYVLNR